MPTAGKGICIKREQSPRVNPEGAGADHRHNQVTPAWICNISIARYETCLFCRSYSQRHNPTAQNRVEGTIESRGAQLGI